MEISIIIPTYNGEKLIQKNLPLLVTAVKGLAAEIIVIDNGSSDNSVNYILQNFPGIKVIPFEENKGFTTACNTGAEKARGEYLLFLNNDCTVTRKNIDLMLSFLKENNKYVATQPVIVNEKNKIQNIGFVVDTKIAKANELTSKEQYSNAIAYTAWPPKNSQFYGLSGTCLLLKADVFKDVGMFDESFHSYLEDVDLMMRLAKRKYQFAACLEATCTHEHMATSKKMPGYKEMQDFKNWLRIITKHYTLSMLIPHFVGITIERLRNANGILKKVLK